MGLKTRHCLKYMESGDETCSRHGEGEAYFLLYVLSRFRGFFFYPLYPTSLALYTHSPRPPPHCSFSTRLLVELDTLFKNNCTYLYTVPVFHGQRPYHTFGSISILSLYFKMLSTKTLLALLPFFLQVNALASGTGTTTRYWDCCKPSCAWPGKAELAAGSNPVTTCDIKDNPLTNYNTGVHLQISSRLFGP